MNDHTFEGSIQVRRWKQGGKWVICLDCPAAGTGLELDLEEAAVLTYQLQMALKDIQEMGINENLENVDNTEE